MPIPNQTDYALAEINNLAGSIMISLRTMAHAQPQDMDKLRMVLCERAQDFIDKVFEFANRAG